MTEIIYSATAVKRDGELSPWNNAAVTWAIDQPVTGRIDKLVLAALAKHSDCDGWCWPKQETLAGIAGCSVDTVQRSLKRLSVAGLISRTRRGKKGGGRTSDLYRLHMQNASDLQSKHRKMRSNVKPQNAVFKHRKMRQEEVPLEERLVHFTSSEHDAATVASPTSEQGFKNVVGPAAPASVCERLRFRAEGYGLPADDLAARACREAPRAADARFTRLACDGLCERLPGLPAALAKSAMQGQAGPARTVMELMTLALDSRVRAERIGVYQ